MRLWKHCANALVNSSKARRVQEGESPEVIAWIFGIGRTAIYRWLAGYRRGGWGALKANPLFGRPPKLDGKKLGLYGFGAAAHTVAQVAKWQGRTVFAFTRPGDVAAQSFARSLGATWAGGSDQDGLDFLRLFPEIGIVTKTPRYPLSQANQALADLRAGRFEGAAVLVP
ncbi:MAG: helix-turn-helix domain-containing protein [Methylocella sp.]